MTEKQGADYLGLTAKQRGIDEDRERRWKQRDALAAVNHGRSFWMQLVPVRTEISCDYIPRWMVWGAYAFLALIVITPLVAVLIWSRCH